MASPNPTLRFRLMAVLILIVSLAPIGAAQPEETESLREQLDRVERLIDRRRYDRAEDGLKETLAAFKDSDEARARLSEIIELKKKIDFGLVVDEPDPKTLVNGKLKRWNRTTGALKLEYDFSDGVHHHADRNPESDKDWVIAKSLLVHKLLFAGPYSAKLEIENGEGSLVMIRGDDDVIGINVAILYRNGKNYLAGSVRHSHGGTETETEPFQEVWKSAKMEIKIEAKVQSRSIRVKVNGKTRFRLDNDEQYGRLALSTRHDLQTLIIAGKAEPAFLQQKLDRALQSQREAFEKDWNARRVLPPWLFETMEVKKVEGLLKTKDLPGNSDEMGEIWRERLDRELDRGSISDAERSFAELKRQGLNEAGKLWYESLLHLLRGDLDLSLEALAGLRKKDPRFLEGHCLHAEVLRVLGSRQDAEKAARKVLADFPNDTLALERMIPLLMRLGQATDCKKLVEAAVARGLSSKRIRQLDETLTKAMNGPRFARRYEHESKHFRVVSDIDSRVCRQAANILEQGFRSYVKEILPLEGGDKKRFDVFIFSGEAGYQAYMKGVLGSEMPGSAGVYSFDLKQLLIWNVHSREAMEQTIRHEGFHQYLDRVLPNAPIWLNEGLAEYNETASLEFGKWKTGKARKDHMRTLERFWFKSLPDYLHIDIRGFQQPSSMRMNYARAWLIVHYLLEGPAHRRQLFDDYVKKLHSGMLAGEATKAVFKREVTEQLEKELEGWLKKLGDGTWRSN